MNTKKQIEAIKPFTFWMPVTVWYKLKSISAKQHTPIKDLILTALKQAYEV